MEKKETKQLLIVNYSSSPGPRYCNQGDDSGEDFYHKVLNASFYKAISSNCLLEVVLDGTDGYASSFLDEAFGNLVYDFGETVVRSTLLLKSDEEPEWIDMLENSTFKEWENRRKESKAPNITGNHSDWYRLIDGNFVNKKWL